MYSFQLNDYRQYQATYICNVITTGPYGFTKSHFRSAKPEVSLAIRSWTGRTLGEVGPSDVPLDIFGTTYWLSILYIHTPGDLGTHESLSRVPA